MSSVFVNPKVDYAFKMIFGSERNKPLLISFLNAMLHAGEPVITAVEILNPYLPSNVAIQKDTYVDVQAKLSDGSLVLIEMQMSFSRAFFRRVLYNNAKRYSSHLYKGMAYTELFPVISLIVADFVYNESDPRPLTQFKLQEVETHQPYPAANDFQIAVVELPKFGKSSDALHHITDQWLYFLQHAGDLQEVPDEMRETMEIEKAFDTVRRINLSELELIAIDRRERDEAMAQRELALTAQENLEKGIDITREKIVREMLGQGFSVAEIARVTAVPLDIVQRIQTRWQEDVG